MITEGMQDFGTAVEVLYTGIHVHRTVHKSGNFIHRVRAVGANIDDLPIALRAVDSPDDGRGDVGDVSEGPSLRSIPKNAARIFLHNLVHENPDHISVPIPQILPLAVHVMRPKNDIV
jgi:hypothetical protein